MNGAKGYFSVIFTSFALKRLKVATTIKINNGSNEFIRFND